MKKKIDGFKLGRAIIWFCLFICIIFESLDSKGFQALFHIVGLFISAYLFQNDLGEALK